TLRPQPPPRPFPSTLMTPTTSGARDLPLHPRATALLHALRHRVLILDGAMGTMIQARELTESEVRGDAFRDHPHALDGAHDLLGLTRPDVIRAIHDAYLEAG